MDLDFSKQAVWFTEEQGLDGPVFGAADKWNGVGIFFDSFDNDAKVSGKPGKLRAVDTTWKVYIALFFVGFMTPIFG